ncbi:hypothetical protein EGM70_13715 [Enterobacteriaceae bacterium 89]|nr:hypothetical protein [Enterobacteriaceae bacterium 89]
MGRYVLNFTIKFLLFWVVMLLVAKAVPYEGLVDQFMTDHFDYDRVKKVSGFIMGEPAPEPWDDVQEDISIFINTLISVPLMSLMTAAFEVVMRHSNFSDSPKLWVKSTTRRFSKIFGFTFIFWATINLIPYDSIEGINESNFLATTAFIFNLLLVITVYLLIKQMLKKAANHQPEL